jgi:hypothetical protein
LVPLLWSSWLRSHSLDDEDSSLPIAKTSFWLASDGTSNKYMDVTTVVMLAIIIIAVLKTFTLTLVFTCKCHYTPTFSMSALSVDRQFSIIILRNE